MKHYFRFSVPARAYFTVELDSDDLEKAQSLAAEAVSELQNGDGLTCLDRLAPQLAGDVMAHITDAVPACDLETQ